MSRIGWGLTVAAALAAVAAALLASRCATSTHLGFEPADRGASSSGSNQAAASDVAPAGEVSPEVKFETGETSASARAAVEASTTDTWMIDVGSTVDDGAFEISCNVLDNDVLGLFVSRDDTVGLYLLEDRTRRILQGATRATSLGGPTELTLPPGVLEHGGCLWVTHPATEPRMLIVAREAERPPVVRLPEPLATPRAWITVRHSDGRPAEGATVQQQALPPDPFEATRATQELLSRRALVRETRTDAEGRTPRIPMAGPTSVVAALDGGLRRVFLDESAGDVEIVLAATFSIGGRVRAAHGTGPWAMAEVRDIDVDGRGQSVATSAISEATQTFGPLTLALDPDIDSFLVRIDHGTFVPQDRILTRPRAGEHLQVDFDVEAGVVSWVLAEDADTSEPVAGAIVEWRWAEGGKAVQGTGPEGYAAFTSLAPVRSTVRVRAAGYATFEGGELDLGDPATPQVLVCALERGATIEGRVDFGTEEPQRVVVAYDHSGKSALDEKLVVEAGDGGRFVVADLAPGAYAFQGVLADGRPTSFSRVTVDRGSASRVELDIAHTIQGRGRVIDVTSGEAIEGAQVALVVRDLRGIPIVTLEDRIVTDSRGEFEVSNAPVIHGGLVVSADGYDSYSSPLPAVEPLQANIDLGTIGLRESAETRVRLSGVSAAETYSVQWYRRQASRVRFDDEGGALLEPGRGETQLALIHPSGVEDRTYGYSGGGESVELLAAEHPIELELEGVNEACRGAPLVMQFLWTDRLGNHSYRRMDVWPDVPSVPGIPAARVHVTASSLDGQCRSSGVHELTSGQPLRLHFRQPDLQVRIVERDGEPIVGADVTIDLVRDGVFGGQETRRTDADGVVWFVADASREVLLWVGTPDERGIVQRRYEVAADRSLEIEVGPRIARRIVLRDSEGGAVPNAAWNLRPVLGNAIVRRGTTDLGGSATIDGVEFDEIHFEAHRADLWPVSIVLRGRGAQLMEVSAHVRGDLTIECSDASGAPLVATVAARHATLRHFDRVVGDLGGDVARWMQAGLLPLTPLRTDASGRLTLEGLPDGDYHVTVETSESVMSGLATVRPGEESSVRIVVP